MVHEVPEISLGVEAVDQLHGVRIGVADAWEVAYSDAREGLCVSKERPCEKGKDVEDNELDRIVRGRGYVLIDGDLTVFGVRWIARVSSRYVCEGCVRQGDGLGQQQ